MFDELVMAKKKFLFFRYLLFSFQFLNTIEHAANIDSSEYFNKILLFNYKISERVKNKNSV